MRLIDILNKIANGELKEGTKVITKDGEEFTYKKSDIDEEYHELLNEDCESLFSNYYIDLVADEVELIEPQEPTECEHEWNKYSIGRLGRTENYRKCKKCRIHEEDIEPTDNTKIEELDREEMLCLTLQCAIAVLTDKLNEVINKVNVQTTVILSQEKDIEDIKSDLDY